MKRVEFGFEVTLNKAYKSTGGGMRVVGAASDTVADVQGERMSSKAIKSMAAQAKKGIPLLDNHRDTHGYGKSVDGWVEEKGDQRVFMIEFELDPKYPQSIDLYSDINKGTSDKQMSIGGTIDPNNPAAVTWERSPQGQMCRVINEITLDHVASTRAMMAANERTGFISAVIKALTDSVAAVKPRKSQINAAVALKSYPMLPIEQSFVFTEKDRDGLLAPDGGNWPQYKNAHAWYDPDEDPEDPTMPEEKDAYKFPHHVVKDGKLATVFEGVAKAAASLLGVRNAVEVLDQDKAGVAKHLAGHFREFGKTPPPELDALAKGKVAATTWDAFVLHMKDVNGVDVSTWDVVPDATDAKADEPEVKKEEGKADETSADKKPEDKSEAKPEDKKDETAAVVPDAEKGKEAAKSDTDADVKKDDATESLADRVTKAIDESAKAQVALSKETVAKAVVPVTKGMYDITRFAELLASLSYLVQSAEYEAESEKDDSPVPAKLRAALAALGAVFQEMAAEEISELLAKGKPTVSIDVVAVVKDRLTKEDGDVFKSTLADMMGFTVAKPATDAAVKTSAFDEAQLTVIKETVGEALKAQAQDLVAAAVKGFEDRLKAIEESLAKVTKDSGAVRKDTDSSVIRVATELGVLKGALESLQKVAGVSQALGADSGTDDVLNRDEQPDKDSEERNVWTGALGNVVEQALKSQPQRKSSK